MGTSTSSGGSPGGVALIPPWVPPVPPAPPPDPQTEEPPDAPGVAPAAPEPDLPTKLELAPSHRFFGARLNLGQYARNGLRDDLRAGLRAYTTTGLRGPKRAAARMAGTSRTAGNLYGVLHALSTGQPLPADLNFNAAALVGRSVREIGDAIADAIRPSDGTLDAEASRDAIAQALSDLIDQIPGVDLAALTPEQIDLVVERYVAYDLCHRIELDVGSHIQDKAPNVAAAVTRIEDMKAYVRESVSAQFRSAQRRDEVDSRPSRINYRRSD